MRLLLSDLYSTQLPARTESLPVGFVDSAATNLLQIPPAAATIVFLFICSELLRRRLINAFPLVIASTLASSFASTLTALITSLSTTVWLLVIVGYILLLKISAPGVRYFAVTLVTAAAGVIYPCLWPRRIQALRGTAGAALGIGVLPAEIAVLYIHTLNNIRSQASTTPVRSCPASLARSSSAVRCRSTPPKPTRRLTLEFCSRLRSALHQLVHRRLRPRRRCHRLCPPALVPPRRRSQLVALALRARPGADALPRGRRPARWSCRGVGRPEPAGRAKKAG